jgi:hypothetical protein
MTKPLFTIKHDFLEGSPAFAPFLEEYAKLIKKGWARPYTAHNNKHKALWAQSPEGEVMGVVAYVLNLEMKMGWITFSFTIDKFKHQGVYTALHKALEGKLKDAGMLEVCSNVHVDNAEMLAAAAKSGRNPEFIRLRKKLVY